MPCHGIKGYANIISFTRMQWPGFASQIHRCIGSYKSIHGVHRFKNMYPWGKRRVVHCMFFLEEYRVTSSEQAGKNDIIANPKKTPLPVRLILPLYIIWKPTNRFSSLSRPTNGPLQNNFAQGNSTASPGGQEIADTRNGTWPRDALRWLGKKSWNWLETLYLWAIFSK